MKFVNKMYWNWSVFNFLKETDMLKEDITISVIEDNFELMIFFAINNGKYEIKINKVSPTDKYIPNEEDNIKEYTENDEYIIFLFENFEFAHKFIISLPYLHSEYKNRPIKKIENRYP